MRFFITVFLLIPLTGSTQFHRVAPVPDWVNEVAIEGVTKHDTACSSGGSHYLLADRQFHLGEEGAYYRLVTQLVTPEAVQNGSRVEMNVDPSYERLDLHTLRIIRNGQVIDQLPTAYINVLQRERDLNAFLYDGTRSVVVELHDVRPGDIVDHSFSIYGNDAAGDGRFHSTVSMGFSVPLARHHVRFIVPQGRSLRFAQVGMDEPPREKDGRWGREHVWDRHGLACIRAESGMPHWYDAYPMLEATEFADLEELRGWALAQFNVEMDLGPALDAFVSRLSRLSGPDARMDSVLHLVQREVRYLGLEEGISAYRPRPPAQVYAQRFGDCKDKSLLLVALLRKIGVQAWPALVSTTHGKVLNERLPRPSLFNHCIAVLEHNGRSYWLDPTMSHNHGPLAERFVPDMGHALVIDPKATGWSAMATNELGEVDIHERFILDRVGGGAILEVETRYGRREADRIRAWLAGRGTTQVSDEYRDYYRRTWNDLSLLTPVKWQDDVKRNVVTVQEQYQIEGIWDTLGTGWEMSVYPNVLHGYMDVPVLRTRESPYGLSMPVDVTHRITMQMPEPWKLATGSEVIEGHGVRYESLVEVDGNEVRLTYRYRSDSAVVQAVDMVAFHAQQKRIVDDMGMRFTHDQSTTGQLSTWTRIHGYGSLLVMVLISIWGAVRVYRWDPEPHPVALGRTPTTIGGGWCYH